jgi:hypothetical protein
MRMALRSLAATALFGLAPLFVFAGCLGEDVTAAAPLPAADADDAGAETSAPAGDAGSVARDGGTGSALPLIDQYSISFDDRPGDQTACIAAIDGAMRTMGGGYATTTTPGASFARYGDRSGATVSASCVDLAAAVVTEAWAVKGAADAQKDEARLLALVKGNPPGGASVGVVGLPTLSARQRIAAVPGGLPVATCQARAKRAIDGALAKDSVSPGTWSTTAGAFLAVGGVAGSSMSITCVRDTGVVILDVVTLDPTVVPDAVVDALQVAFNAAK